MMTHAWPIVLRGGLLDPRGYPPLYALMIVSHRVLRYASPLLHVRRARVALACSPRGGCTRAALAAQVGAARRGGGRRARRRAAAAGRPLLRADDRLARRRPLRPPAPRHAGRLGAAGGDAVSVLRPRRKRALDLALAGAALARRVAPCWRVAVAAIRLESPGTRSTASAASAATASRSSSTSCARWSPAPSAWARASPSTRATSASPASARCLRRTSLDELPNLVNVVRGEMSLVGPRPTVQVQVDRYTERQRGRLAGGPASPAGRRSTAARRCRGTSGSSSTSGTSSTRRCGSTCASSRSPCAWC